MSSQALVHLPGLGSNLATGPKNIDIRVALRPAARRLVEHFGPVQLGQARAHKSIGKIEAPAAITAIFCPHPAVRQAWLATSGLLVARRLAEASAQFAQSSGRPDSADGLQYLHALTRQLLGHTASVDEAKQKIRACILNLHPDKGRMPLSMVPAKDARDLLLSRYIEAMRGLEAINTAPYMVGTVAFTSRQAAAVGFAALSKRIGHKKAVVVIGVATSGTATAAAVGLYMSSVLQVIALHFVVVVLTLWWKRHQRLLGV